MVSLYDGGVYLVNGKEIVPEAESAKVKALTGKELWLTPLWRPTTHLRTWSI